VHAYKDMLSLNSLEAQEGPAKGDPRASKKFSLTVDFADFHTMKQLGKGTGYDAQGEAKVFKNQVKEDRKRKIKSVIDTGCIKDASETIFRRLRRAQLAKEGIDMDDKRDKVMIAKEKQETKQLVKDCFKMA